MDVASLGYMLSLAQGQSTFFNLQLAGIAPELEAYIPYWLGAFSIQIFPFIKPDLAARLPFVLSALLGMLCLWQAIYFLARNQQAQPVAFAFAWAVWTSQFVLIMSAGLISLILLAVLNKEKRAEE